VIWFGLERRSMIERGGILCELMSANSLLCCLSMVVYISERPGVNSPSQCKCTPIKSLWRAVTSRGNGRIKTADIAARIYLQVTPLSIALALNDVLDCLNTYHLCIVSLSIDVALTVFGQFREILRLRDAYFRLKNIHSIFSHPTWKASGFSAWSYGCVDG
jgi:hypothetical protein